MVETMQSLKYVLIFKKETAFWETVVWESVFLGNWSSGKLHSGKLPSGKIPTGKLPTAKLPLGNILPSFKGSCVCHINVRFKTFFNLSVVSILFLFMVQTRYRQIYVYNIS